MEPGPRLHRKWNQVRRGLFGIRRPNWKLNARRKQQLVMYTDRIGPDPIRMNFNYTL